MAISSETSSVTYAGNNSTSTAYTLAFPFSGASEIVVTHITAAGVRNTLAVTTGYTLHGDPAAGTGTLKTVAAIPVTDSLLIERFTAVTQSLDSSSPAGSYPTSIETQLDRTVRAVQDNKRIASRNLARSLRVPDGETAAELPAATLRKGEVLYFNATTGAVETKTPDEILALSAGGLDLTIGTVTTGAAGTSAAASVSGTAPAKLLNLTIPRGDPGAGLPALQNEAGLAKFFDEIMRLDEATEASPVAVMLTGFSDSMPGYVGQQLVMDLAERFGLAALCSPEFGLSWNGAAASVVLTGSAAAVTNDYTALPNSGEINLPAGGKYSLAVPDFGLNPAVLAWIGSGDTDEYAMSAGRRPIALPHGITKVSVFYKVEPGAGDITGTLLQTGLSNVTSTVAAAGTLALGTMELTPADAFAPLTIEVSAATAAVRMLGIVFWTGGSGIGYWSSAKGSTKMDDQLPGLVAGEWNATYTALFAALNTGLVLHAQRASDAGTEADNYQARYADFFDAYETLGASQLVFAEPSREPLAENALTTDVINAWLRTECETRGIAYFDRKAIVPATSPFKDVSTDGIHRDPREHRYIVGRLLAAAGYFRSAYSRFGGSDLTKGDLAAERFRGLAAARARTRDFIGQGGFTYFSTTWTGAGFGNPTATSDTGFNFVTAAGVAGHSAAVFGIISGGASQLDTTLGDIAISANGYRNLNLPAGGGHRAALIFGQSSTIITDITSITTRCYGVEFAHGTDLGGGLGAAEYMRIFAHNGTSMTYGRWVLCNTASGTPSANGITIMLHWQRQRQRLVLWGNGNHLGLWPRTSLAVPAFAYNATASAWVQGYIRTSGTGHSAGKMQWQHISGTFGEIALPYAL